MSQPTGRKNPDTKPEVKGKSSKRLSQVQDPRCKLGVRDFKTQLYCMDI